MNLLIVDDEIIIIKGLLASIDWQSLGIQKVYAAYSAAEARELIASEPIDFVISDIEMPGENGLELLEWSKLNYPHLIFTLLTCHANFNYAKESVRLDAFDYVLKPVDADNVEAIISNMKDRYTENIQNQEMIRYGRQWVESKIEKATQRECRKKATQILTEAETYILSHLSEELSLDRIADKFFISPDYLGRIFKKEKQISLNQFIIRERMKLAAHLIENTQLSTQIIAFEVGYNNYQSFINMFKKEYGVTPSQYKTTKEEA